MTYAAIDLHKTVSQVRILLPEGPLDCRVPTTRDRLRTLFESREPMRVLLEAATDSEWVAELLERLGHDVVVADPNYLPMYGERSRRIKTDRRDVAALAEACRLKVYRPAHRRSAAHWDVQRQLMVREHLIRMRTRSILVIRCLAQMAGVPVRACHAETVPRHMRATELPAAIQKAMDPLLTLVDTLTEALRTAETALTTIVAADPAMHRLLSMPGIGPITAAAFIAALDDAAAFGNARQVASYLGLVPREYSSGEHQHRGHILRSAHPRVQSLLVEAAWRICRSTHPDVQGLRTWALSVAQRRGRRIAAIALARRISRILYAMWRDDTDYAGRSTLAA